MAIWPFEQLIEVINGKRAMRVTQTGSIMALNENGDSVELTAEKDDNGEYVLRITDAAPYAYDPAKDVKKIRIEDYKNKPIIITPREWHNKTISGNIEIPGGVTSVLFSVRTRDRIGTTKVKLRTELRHATGDFASITSFLRLEGTPYENIKQMTHLYGSGNTLGDAISMGDELLHCPVIAGNRLDYAIALLDVEGDGMELEASIFFRR